MSSLSVPLALYPATVVLIDDNEKLLKNIQSVVLDEAPCLTFSNPGEAIDFIKQNRQKFTRYDSVTYYCIGDDERFAEVSVAIVDYSMPSMNGLEVCEHLKGLGLKIVLLTGDADEAIAVEAFNNRLINRYIKKSVENLHGTLLSCINDLQYEWCLHKSIESLSVITNGDDAGLGKCFGDEELKPFFTKMLGKYEIAEHYYISAPANLLLLDKGGKPYFLTIKSEDEFEDLIAIAMDQYENLEISDLAAQFQDLEKKKQILLFF